MLTVEERIRGCLLGGAMGDALGYPVEFLGENEIFFIYGPGGIRELITDPEAGEKSIVSDDTQMTLFTACGMVNVLLGADPEGIYHGYLRWYRTQRGSAPLPEDEYLQKTAAEKEERIPYLPDVQALYAQRAPGGTCLSALASGVCGTTERPINNSKGCGGVMRTAPCGLFGLPTEEAYAFGAAAAAITHGHPSGYVSAGALSALIADLCEGIGLPDALERTLQMLKNVPGAEETALLLERARTLAGTDIRPIDAIHKLGEGWVGEEALAIAVYCALRFDSPAEAVIAAVNHKGDSDSTGAICGNLVGAACGAGAFGGEWTERVEFAGEIGRIIQGILYTREKTGK